MLQYKYYKNKTVIIRPPECAPATKHHICQ